MIVWILDYYNDSTWSDSRNCTDTVGQVVDPPGAIGRFPIGRAAKEFFLQKIKLIKKWNITEILNAIKFYSGRSSG